MLILALDTTTRSGSIAVARDETLLAVVSGDGSKTHAERLPADIVRILAGQQLRVSDVDVFAVAAGPGSFTGLRIGIATVQGLAFAMNRLVVPVSTLDALAHVAAATSSGGALVAAFMDAQRSEVFAALYRAAGSQSPPTDFETIDGPVSQPPAIVLDRWKEMTGGGALRPGSGQASSAPTTSGQASSGGGASSAPTTSGQAGADPMTGDAADGISIAGDGVARYRELVIERLGSRARPVEPLPPLAPTIARIAAREAAAGRAVAPHAIRPVYVRRPDAELARDRDRHAPAKVPHDPF